MPNITIRAARQSIDAKVLELDPQQRKIFVRDPNIFVGHDIRIEYWLEDKNGVIFEYIWIQVEGYENLVTISSADDKLQHVTVGGINLAESQVKRNSNHIDHCLAAIRGAYIRAVKAQQKLPEQ